MSLECPICSDPIKQDAVCTACGHIFHESCLKYWLMRSSTCPQCRAKSTLSDVRKIFAIANSAHPSIGTNSYELVKLKREILEIKTELAKSTDQFCTALKNAETKIAKKKNENMILLAENSIAKKQLRKCKIDLANTKDALKRKETELASKIKCWRADEQRMKTQISRLDRVVTKCKEGIRTLNGHGNYPMVTKHSASNNDLWPVTSTPLGQTNRNVMTNGERGSYHPSNQQKRI